MASVVGICNKAIIRCGNSNLITSLTEDLKPARLCNAVYEEIRDSMLRAHPWNFATKRQSLVLIEGYAGSIEFDNAFELPNDVLKIQYVDCGTYAKRVENVGTVKAIVTNSPEADLIYIARITDPNLMDPLFRDALSATIAAEICTSLTDNASLTEKLIAAAKEAVSMARTVDAQEGDPVDPDTDLYEVARI